MTTADKADDVSATGHAHPVVVSRARDHHQTIVAPEAAASKSPFVGYVGFVTRAVALVIDAICVNVAAILFSAAVALLLSLVGISRRLSGGEVVAGSIIWAFIWSGSYFVFFWSVTGQTVGARVMGFRVVTADGFQQLRFRQALHRVVWFFICELTLGIGFLPVLVSDKRQGLHDKRADTVVRWGRRARQHEHDTASGRP